MPPTTTPPGDLPTPDANQLLHLLSTSTTRLSSLYTELGHPPARLASAISDLHATLHSALTAQMDAVQGEVDSVKAKIARREGRVGRLVAALGGASEAGVNKGRASNTAASAQAGRRSTRRSTAPTNANKGESAAGEQPLLTRMDTLQAEITRLEALYASRTAQADKLAQQLQSFRPILGEFVPDVQTEVLPAEERNDEADDAKNNDDTSNEQNKDAATTKDGSSTPIDYAGPLPVLPAAHLTQLSTAIDRCGCELAARFEQFHALLDEIARLWSELCLPPETEGQEQPTFDALILRHLRYTPKYEAVLLEEGADPVLEFQGEFLPVELDHDADMDMDGSGDCGGLSSPNPPDTPTRGGATTLSHAAAGLTPLRTAETQFPPHVLLPTPRNISLANARAESLLEEKARREARIQEVYDEVERLWTRCGVSQEEMDAFVAEHVGSTLAVVQSYEAELEKMRELKSRHMAYFLGEVRARIAALWDELRMSDEEREMDFPDFYMELPGAGGEHGGLGDDPALTDDAALDALLERHEAKAASLTEDLAAKAPILRIISRYFALLEEERQLEESAKDSTRLMRGARGDPGRLLREEKMRKRIKVQKPKLEGELMRAIPAWEEENGRAFTVDGERYLERVTALVEASGGAAGRKRTRTASVATPAAAAAATPGVLQQSASTRTNRLASQTPGSALRTPSAATSMTATAKKQRLISATPASTRQPSSSRVPMLQSQARTQPTPATATRRGNPPRSALNAGKTPRTQAIASATANAAAKTKPQANGQVTASQARASGAHFSASQVFRPRPSQVFPPPQSQSQAHSRAPSTHAGYGQSYGHGYGSTAGLPRTISGASIASDATTLHYPHLSSRGSVSTSVQPNRPAYASAIPAKTHASGASHGQGNGYAAAPPAAPAQGSTKPSVNHARSSGSHAVRRRAPSMALEGQMASLAAAGYARPGAHSSGAHAHAGTREASGSSIRAVSSQTHAEDFPEEEGYGEEGAGGGGGNWAVLDEADEEAYMDEGEFEPHEHAQGQDSLSVF